MRYLWICGQKVNRIVYFFSLTILFLLSLQIKSVFGCWCCRNHGLSFIQFYSIPISPFKVNLRFFGSEFIILFYKKQFHFSHGAWCGSAQNEAALAIFLPMGHLGRAFCCPTCALVGESPWPPAQAAVLVQLLACCCSSSLLLRLMCCIPFVRPWGLERRLCSWASENPRYKLFPFLWASWPWIHAVARNMSSHLAASRRDM